MGSLGLVLCGLLPGLLSAQRVVGRVVEEGTDAPVSGAFVVLLDEPGTSRLGGLAAGTGRFALRVPAPGRYRLRVDRIGYESLTTEPFEVGKGETVTWDLAVPTRPVELGAIAVSGRGRCRLDPEAGEDTWRVWSEARKALRLTLWTESQRTLRFTLAQYERVLDPDRLLVRTESVELSRSVSNRAYSSDSPERLAELGYVRGDRIERTYFAPDAAVLLSDVFLDGHCFRVVAGENPALIGLSFEPVDPRSRSDVEGVLWLDRESAELRVVDVRYVNPGLPGRIEADRYGARVDYRRLPDGAWIVARWHIRMPLFTRRRGRILVHHFEEIEGEVLGVAGVGGERLPYLREAAAVAGTVRHPRTGAPLAGARVYLDGSGYQTTTDEDGRFRIEGVPGRRYWLAVDADSLALDPLPIELVRGHTMTIDPGGVYP